MFHRTRWACRWRFISSLTHWSFGDDLLPSREASPRTALKIEKPRMDAGHSRHTEGALAPTLTQTDHADMEKTLTVQLLSGRCRAESEFRCGFGEKSMPHASNFVRRLVKLPVVSCSLGLHFSTKHTHYSFIFIFFVLSLFTRLYRFNSEIHSRAQSIHRFSNDKENVL